MYSGGWLDDEYNGKGISKFTNGDKYEGGYINNKRSGKGIYSYKNGERFEGVYLNGEEEGKGIWTFPNGEKYEGNFSKGERQGYGVYNFKNGDKFEGEWVKGKQDKGTYTYADGKTEAGNTKSSVGKTTTTANGVQHSYADMSIFTNVKGCMIILHNNYMNIFVVKGNTMIDKATIAAGCAQKAGFTAGRNYQYEWADEKTCSAVQEKYKFKRSSECNGEYKLPD